MESSPASSWIVCIVRDVRYGLEERWGAVPFALETHCTDSSTLLCCSKCCVSPGCHYITHTFQSIRQCLKGVWLQICKFIQIQSLTTAKMILFLGIVVSLIVVYFIFHRIFVHRKTFTGTAKLNGKTVIVTGRWNTLVCKRLVHMIPQRLINCVDVYPSGEMTTDTVDIRIKHSVESSSGL